jgi:hypothetical protein
MRWFADHLLSIFRHDLLCYVAAHFPVYTLFNFPHDPLRPLYRRRNHGVRPRTACCRRGRRRSSDPRRKLIVESHTSRNEGWGSLSRGVERSSFWGERSERSPTCWTRKGCILSCTLRSMPDPEPQQRTPVAVCSKCGAVSHNPTVINRPCGRMFGQKKCKGVFGSALNIGDWQECPSCAATGWKNGRRCDQCRDSCGWLFVRGMPR